MAYGLHVLVGLLVGDDIGQLEESGLHDGVDAVAHANLSRQLDGVDDVELGVLLGQQLLHGSGQLRIQLLGVHWQFSRNVPPSFREDTMS